MEEYKIAINGLGRIGKLTLRKLLENKNVKVVAINDLADKEVLCHLFKYDSAHGIYPGDVSFDDSHIIIDGHKILSLCERNPEALPWKDLGVDMVIDASGVFNSKEGAEQHISAGAGKVILTAPAKGDVKFIVLGVNDEILNGDDKIISNASCTTNCLAPMVKVLDDNFGFEEGYMTTIHAYTGDQRLQDSPHKDFRRARAASTNMVPTSTGAAKAVGLVLPQVAGKLTGYAMRVPVINGSLTDLTCTVKKLPTVEELNNVFKEAASTSLKGILEYTEAPIVSTDIVGNPHSCIFDSQFTGIIGNLIKIIGWYDNEFGYANRVAELVEKITKFELNTVK